MIMCKTENRPLSCVEDCQSLPGYGNIKKKALEVDHEEEEMGNGDYSVDAYDCADTCGGRAFG